jgi:hypothetical protein
MLGRVIAQAFANEGWEVFHGARRPVGGDAFRRVDLDRPQTVAEAASNADLLVNTVPDSRMSAERVVLEQGGLLLNVAAPPLTAVMALRDRPAHNASGLVALNAGLAPGLTSLVAAELLRIHRDADALEIVITFCTSGTSGRAARAWVHRYLSAERHHATFQVPLPEPYGTRRCLRMADGERGWLVQLPAEVDVRGGACFLERDVDRGLRALNALRLVSLLPRWLLVDPPRFIAPGAREDAVAPTRDPIREWVAVYRAGARLAARSIEGEGDYLMTAVAALSMSESLLQRQANGERGARSIEELLVLDDVLGGLGSRGVSVVARD